MRKAKGSSTMAKPGKGSALWVALASLLLPGLGQLANRQRLKALGWFLVPVLFLSIEFGTSQWGRYFALRQGKVPPESIANETPQAGDLQGQEGSQSQQADSLGALFGDTENTVQPAVQEPSYDGDPFAAAADFPSDTGDPFAPAEGDQALQDAANESYFTATYKYPNYQPGEPQYVVRDFGGFFTKGIWGLFSLGRLVIGQPYAGGTIELYNKVTPWLSADNSVVLLGNGLICMAVLIVFVLLWVLGASDAYSTRKKIHATGEIQSFKEWWHTTWDSLYVYIVSAPSFVLILIFTVIPIFFTFLLAFTNYTYKIKLGAKLIEWVGLNTFKYLALDPGWLSIFGQIFLWTVIWAVMSTFSTYVLGFFNAMVVESPNIKAKKAWRSVMILPWAIPSLVSLMVFRNAFDKDGLVNQFLFASGLMEPVTNFLYRIGLEGRPEQPIFWFQPIYNGNLARFVVIMTNLWLGAPYHMMMITGILTTIPKDLYEAATIDGATGGQRFRYITLPMVLSATIPSLIMSFSFNFNNFGAVYFLTGGGPSWDPAKVPDSMRIVGSAMPGQTDILISWIYKLSFTKGFEQYNIAAVYSIIIFLIVGGFSVYNLMRAKSFREEAGE
ncbi:MAG: sugar ABC transporter permease [Spirochaetaceae bacterium]|nr:sugar ABC transporter permease [Spirochaetaceae bacterium]